MVAKGPMWVVRESSLIFHLAVVNCFIKLDDWRKGDDLPYHNIDDSAGVLLGMFIILENHINFLMSQTVNLDKLIPYVKYMSMKMESSNFDY